jgi:hypothetical protein
MGHDSIEIAPSLGTAKAVADAQIRERLRSAVARRDEAEAKGSPSDLIEALLPLARCYAQMGVYGAAEEALRHALRAARRTGNAQQLAAVLSETAQAACWRADDLKERDPQTGRVSRDRARDSAFEASALIHKHAHAAWAAPALLVVSLVLGQCGDHDDAAVMRARAESWQAQL